jgi:hypothetical protein
VEAVAYVCASASSVSSPRAFLCSDERDLEVNDEGLAFHRRDSEPRRQCLASRLVTVRVQDRPVYAAIGCYRWVCLAVLFFYY